MGIHQTAPNALLYAVAGTDTHASIQVFPDVRHSLGFQGLQPAAWDHGKRMGGSGKLRTVHRLSQLRHTVGEHAQNKHIRTDLGILPADPLGIILESSDQHKMEEAIPTDSVRTELHFLGYRCGDVVHVPCRRWPHQRIN